MRTQTALCAAALLAAVSAAPANAQKAPEGLEGATITCNTWNGRHSMDPKVDWDDVAEDAPLVIKFGPGGRDISFPNSAFPPGAYPASIENPEPGMGILSMGERIVLQSLSPSVVDTITIDGVKSGQLYAVWQRFRFDGERTRAIVLQGPCTRS